MSKKELKTSSFSRLLKLGGLAGQVGASVASQSISNAFRPADERKNRRTDNLAKNAARVAEALGELKGVPMKIGQMLSLQEGMLPKEITETLRSLQQQAPSVPFSSIQSMLIEELGEAWEQVESIDAEPYAAASIGQVHRAVLKDGRDVVFKTQYPGIDKVIAADMKNLKGVLKLIFSMLSQANMDAIWDEMNARLLEELDYEQEASHIQQMTEMYQDDPAIHIPEVIEALSTRHILCMPLLEGISPDRACSDEFGPELRDQWGQGLFKLLIEGILTHRFLHADPNLANFAFCEDGGLIVYDLGCVKLVPPALAEGYAVLVKAVLALRYAKVPTMLQDIEVQLSNGSPLPRNLITDVAVLIKEPFRRRPPYRFGDDKAIYDGMMALSKTHWQTLTQITYPQDIIFIDRAIVGCFGNLGRLCAAGPWREMLEHAADVVLTQPQE